MPNEYGAEPPRTDIDTARGAMVLEFGDSYCGICIAARPAIEQALAGRPDVRHLKIADGRGRPLRQRALEYLAMLVMRLALLVTGKQY